MTTAAGAGTYAATLIRDNGKVRNADAYTANKRYGITRVQIMNAGGSYITMSRSSHQEDDITLEQIADTLADADKVIDLFEMLGGKGVVLEANEGLSIDVTVTANSTIDIFVELDDTIPVTNAYGVRAAGANAAVANTCVETGANVTAAMNPNKKYRARGIYFTSTTIINAQLGVDGNGLVTVPGQNAILTGQGFTVLKPDQAKVLEGTGSTYQSTFECWIAATAADAANVQVINIVFECN